MDLAVAEQAFWYCQNMVRTAQPANFTKYAELFSAMGTESRLRILRLLLAAHPEGMVVSDIQSELGIPGSTLSHHLEKLRQIDLVRVRRDARFLWYSANTETLQELLQFLYAECCTRSKAVTDEAVLKFCQGA